MAIRPDTLVCAALLAALAPSDAAAQTAPVSDEDRIGAAPRLWEYQRETFNTLVRLPDSAHPRFRRLLSESADEDRARSLSILLALNCALPIGHSRMVPLQEYRCGAASFAKLEAWATKTGGDVYALAFARPPDHRTAAAALQAKLRALNAAPVDQVDEKEFLLELINYLDAGGLP